MILYTRLLVFHLLSFIPISGERIRTEGQERLSSMSRGNAVQPAAAQAGQHHHVGGAHTAADGTINQDGPILLAVLQQFGVNIEEPEVFRWDEDNGPLTLLVSSLSRFPLLRL